MFGIATKDRHYATSKLLFETFEYLFEKLSIGDSARSFYFEESPFNVTFRWSSYTKKETEEVIGPIGTYTHEIINGTSTNNTDKVEGTDRYYNIVYTVYVRTIYRSIVGYESRHPFDFRPNTDKKPIYGDYYYEEYEEQFYYVKRCADEKQSKKRNECNHYVTEKITVKKTVLNKTNLGKGPVDTYTNTTVILEESLDSSNTVIVKKQVKEGICEIITVRGFSSISAIGRAGYGSWASAGVNHEGLVIPLLIEVLDKLTPLEKIDTMERTLRFVLYTAQLHIQKLKWYQTGIFKVFTIVLAIAISIISIGFDGGFTAANIMSAISTMFIGMIIGVGVQLALKIIIKFVDIPILRQILMVAVVIAGIYASNYFLDLSTLSTTIMTAVELLNVSTMIVGDLTTTGMNKLQEQMIQFGQAYQNKVTEFEERMKQLFGGITVEDLADITIKNNNNGIELVMLDPFTYYTNALESYSNYDLLYQDKYDILTSSELFQYN